MTLYRPLINNVDIALFNSNNKMLINEDLTEKVNLVEDLEFLVLDILEDIRTNKVVSKGEFRLAVYHYETNNMIASMYIDGDRLKQEWVTDTENYPRVVRRVVCSLLDIMLENDMRMAKKGVEEGESVLLSAVYENNGVVVAEPIHSMYVRLRTEPFYFENNTDFSRLIKPMRIKGVTKPIPTGKPLSEPKVINMLKSYIQNTYNYHTYQ